jgi:hypothetical protein
VCTPGFNQHEAEADLYSVRVTLSETGSPAAAGSGPFWSGGPVWGAVAVTFNASDPSGIQNSAVDGPSGQIAFQQYACDFSQAQPCANVSGGQISVDTTQIPDGTRTVSLLVTNAAGNQSVASSPPVLVDNYGPRPPSNLVATAQGPGSNVVDLAWNNPASPPEPVKSAFAEVCGPSCSAPVAINPGGTAQVSTPGPGKYAIKVWLTDTAGRGGDWNAASAAVTVPPPLCACPASCASGCLPPARAKVRSATWRNGILSLVVSGLPTHDDLRVELVFHHHRPRYILSRSGRIRVRTAKPRELVLQVMKGKRVVQRLVVKRLRR